MTFFIAYVDTEELNMFRMQEVDFKHIYKENIEIITAMNVSKRKETLCGQRWAWAKMDNTDFVLSTDKKKYFVSTIPHFFSLPFTSG